MTKGHEIAVPQEKTMLSTVSFDGDEIRQSIFTIRGVQVMLDRDLASFYGVSTGRLNEQVKRNVERFPERFRFQLTSAEIGELIAKCDRLRPLKHSPSCPYVFTEQGVSQLSSVLLRKWDSQSRLSWTNSNLAKPVKLAKPAKPVKPC